VVSLVAGSPPELSWGFLLSLAAIRQADFLHSFAHPTLLLP